MRTQAEKYRGDELTGATVPTVVELVRHANSSWTFRFRLAGEVTLPDGRVVTVDRRVAVRANEQIGRRRPIVAC